MALDIARLEHRPTPRMKQDYAPPYPRRSLHRRLVRILTNIEARCGKAPSVNNFHRYGGRGIRNFLTLEDLRQLWERDSADTMRQPSIDRKDADGHYTYVNCRFVEFVENRKRGAVGARVSLSFRTELDIVLRLKQTAKRDRTTVSSLINNYVRRGLGLEAV